jgi:mRNA interferase MazF
VQIERYGVYWVDRRPAVVVSDEGMNRHLDTLVVCPLTSTRHPRWPSRVGCTIAGVEGEIAVDQIRTVSRARLGEMLGTLDESEAASIRHIITEMYGVLSVSGTV